jgi:carboxymethylenebutenolidase
MQTLASEGLQGLVTAPMVRRGFMMTSLIAGFTLATTRVDAQAIHTDSVGLEDGEIQVPVDDGHLPGYFARPKGAGPFPVILVVEEIFGLHEYIKDICRRLAKRGYMAVSVELYARIADLSKMTDSAVIFRDVISKAPDATVMSDLDSSAEWAFANHGDRKRLGITGFCRGGREVWLYAAHNPALKAAVAWYGPVAGTDTPIQPQTVLEIAGEIKCPLLGLYGAKDPSIAVPDVQAAAAKARSKGHETVDIVVYPNAAHAFHADYRPSYVRDAAEDGWNRMLAWFHKYGLS